MIADNHIRPEGAKALGEGLKENKTRIELWLYSMSSFRGWIDVCMDAADNLWMVADNQIGPEGAKALGEGLKENKTLMSLNLNSTSSFRVRIDVCMGADNVDGCRQSDWARGSKRSGRGSKGEQGAHAAESLQYVFIS